MIYLLFFTVVSGFIIIERRIQKMAENIEALNSTIESSGLKMTTLIEKITAQLQETKASLVAILALIQKLADATGSAQDFTPQVAAISAQITKIDEAIAALDADNAEVAETLEKANQA